MYTDEELNITTQVVPVTKDNLPVGVWYEGDGAAWQAVLDSGEQKGWRNQPMNWTAFGKGEPTGEMWPHMPWTPR